VHEVIALQHVERLSCVAMYVKRRAEAGWLILSPQK
jgi:hypothetical protein